VLYKRRPPRKAFAAASEKKEKKYCISCGAQINLGAEYCGKCGQLQE
jgi:ribosomal protein L40E